tara:strand:- start:509 stop:1126 length:618 start_codon:yes stop_codon:yes gene_type:complete
MLILGLTGLTGSGKSTVSKYLLSKEALIFDLDGVAHELYKSGTETFYKIVSCFGEDILNQYSEIDRKKLSFKVFNNLKDNTDKIPNKLNELESIIWPDIDRVIKETIDANSDKELMVLDGALLIQAGFDKYCDHIWILESCIKHIKSRLSKLNKIDFLDEKIQRSNLSDKKISKYTTLKNNLTKQDLYNNVESLFEVISKDSYGN